MKMMIVYDGRLERMSTTFKYDHQGTKMVVQKWPPLALVLINNEAERFIYMEVGLSLANQ